MAGGRIDARRPYPLVNAQRFGVPGAAKDLEGLVSWRAPAAAVRAVAASRGRASRPLDPPLDRRDGADRDEDDAGAGTDDAGPDGDPGPAEQEGDVGLRRSGPKANRTRQCQSVNTQYPSFPTTAPITVQDASVAATQSLCHGHQG